MEDKIDETLDAMTPQELASIESEIDKAAAEAARAYYFDLGRKLAVEASEAVKQGGTTPALEILKQAVQPAAKTEAAEPSGAEIDQFLDKCSAEDLAEIEKSIDAKLEAEKSAKEYAGFYFEAGRKLARTWSQGQVKQAARVPVMKVAPKKPRAPKMPGEPAALGELGSLMQRHPLATGIVGGVIGTKLLE